MLEGKRGWMLIVEVVLAVLILFGFLFTAISRQAGQAKISDKYYLYNTANELALRAEKNNTVRNYVLEENEDKINDILETMVKGNENVRCCITTLESTCEINKISTNVEGIRDIIKHKENGSKMWNRRYHQYR